MGSLEITDLPHDMTKEEREDVLAFIANGCPGLLKVLDSDMWRYFNLYMNGKTYSEIATVLKVNKTLILYLSYKSKWLDHKFKYYQDISLNLLKKIQEKKLDIANTLLVAITAEGKYLENEYNRYLTTNDKTIIERLDTRKTGVFLKLTNALDNIMKSDNGSDDEGKLKQPLVNINMAMGSKATIEQTGEKTLEITDETAGELVKALAGMKKAIDKK